MERKEQRVGVGVGAFHNPPRAQYSEETRNVIKCLYSKTETKKKNVFSKII